MKKTTLFLVAFALLTIVFGSYNTASATVNLHDEGCALGYAFNPYTGESCSSTILPEGCKPGYLYSPLTGVRCVPLPTPVPAYPVGQIIIDGVSGPQKLDIGEKGTWKVKAHDSEGRDLSYSVKWGDEYVIYSDALAVAPSYEVQQSATFTHAYTKGGTYYPTFTISNEYGSESTSLSVKVGEEYCPAGGYNPVTGASCSKGEITPGYMPEGQVGYNYQTLFNISGYPSSVAYQYKWAVKKGSLPAGLVLQQTYSATGIVGIPTKAETRTFVISADNGEQELTKEYTITVKPASKSYDTDGGKNYFVKGETYGVTKCVNQSACTPSLSVDTCDTDTLLHEYYIGEDGYKYVEFYYSPTGCKDGAAGSYTQNSIKVLSPNGGESWGIGKTYTIRWTTGQIYCIQAPCVQPSIPETVGIDLVGYNSDTAWDMSIARSVPNTGSYSWTVPSLTVGAKYKLAIRKAGGGELYDQSDGYFKVTIGNISSIQVLSPNGGETWQKGTTQNIKWRGDDIYEINLLTYYPPLPPCTTKYCAQPTYAIMNYLLAGGVKYGSFEWKVGRDGSGNEIPEGLYTVQMCKAGISVCDSSDNYFKITNSSTTNDLSITTSSSLPNATAGQYYSVDLLASGGTGFYGWDTGLTAFPIPGLGLSIGNTNCSDSNSSSCSKAVSSIVGIPAKVYVAGVEQRVPYPFTFNLTLTSGSQSITKKFSLTVNPAAIDSDENYKPGTVGGYIYGAESYNFTKKLELGSEGSEVKELQKYLAKNGYYRGDIDGRFGIQTQTALVSFQITNGLTADGVVGAAVRALLNK